MSERNVLAFNRGFNADSCLKQRKTFSIKSRHHDSGGRLVERLLNAVKHKAQEQIGQRKNKQPSLFIDDPKGRIEERRVNVLYDNSLSDINGKL